MRRLDREEATKEDNFDLSNDYEDEEDEDWEATGGDWENEGDEAEDVKDESTAYLEFLNEEVSSDPCMPSHASANDEDERG